MSHDPLIYSVQGNRAHHNIETNLHVVKCIEASVSVLHVYMSMSKQRNLNDFMTDRNRNHMEAGLLNTNECLVGYHYELSKKRAAYISINKCCYQHKTNDDF